MLRPLRNILRLLVIARVLARHGALQALDDALAREGASSAFLQVVRFLFGRGGGSRRPGERLADALGELGPAFIKLGQMLSTRTDLLGEQVAADLSLLQDRLPPFPAAAARATVEAELGQPVDSLFQSFEEQPVSAASIAQVHFALLPADAAFPIRQVAVKILRPGIEQAFQRDLDLLFWLAGIVERTQPRLRRFRPLAVIREFARSVALEMDLRLEAAAAVELAGNFAEDPTYRVPAIDWERTAKRVLTQERIAGIRMDDRAALLAAGHDIPDILAKAAAIFFNQLFRDGFFHGDQHPGNMLVDAEGRIGAVDFGIMGRLDRQTRYYLADMLLGLLERDYRRLADLHFAAGFVPDDQSHAEFAQALRAIGEPVFGRPLADISFARMLGQLFQIATRFDMQVQPQLLLLQKNMMMAEGVSRRLDPTLNIWTLAQPLIERWMRDNRGPEARVADALESAFETATRLPRVLRLLERRLETEDERQRTEETRLRIVDRPLGWWLAGLLLLLLLIHLL